MTATKNRYATLRGGDEADGDTEDDSHISRVLRNYYTEQGRPFPLWLGGGPQQHQQQGRPGQPNLGGINLRRGNNANTGPQQGVKATLSDIWDAPAQQQPSNSGHPQQGAGQNATSMNKMKFFRRDQQSPAPSQQPHSYDDAPTSNQSAQSSIRDRLWSNRGANQGRTPSPQPQQQTYQSHAGYGGRDKSPARGPPSHQQYHQPSGNGYARAGDNKPVMSATISFGQDDYDYSGYAPSGGGSQGGSSGGSSGYRRGTPLQGGKVGLPTGPKMNRQGVGYDR